MEIHAIAIGSELIKGWVQDSNTQWIASVLPQEGYQLSSAMIIGDDMQRMVEVLRQAEAKGGFYIVTGGLGPTEDDFTRFAAAKAFDLKMYLDEERLTILQKRYQEHGVEMPESNKVQVQFPEGSEILDNPMGTASGFLVTRGQSYFVFLPGVPHELKEMLGSLVMPQLKKIATPSHPVISRILRVFGITEAQLGEIVQKSFSLPEGISLSYLPSFPEIRLIFATNGKVMDGEGKLQEMESRIIGLFGDKVFARDDTSLEVIVGKLLTEQQKSLALAESCTGGLISDMITNVPGSSGYFDLEVTAYSNFAKSRLLQVPEELITVNGAVSEPVARAMSQGVRSIKQSDFGLGVTGIAGPEGGSPEKPVGTVFISLDADDDNHCFRFALRWDRRRNKILSAYTALDMLRRKLLGIDVFPFS